MTPPSPSDPERRFVELSGGPAAYTDEGVGQPVVLVHGLPGSSRDFRWLAPWLSEAARVIRPDLPGFGKTPIAAGPDPSPEGRARFVLELLDALEVERSILVGHSMGGVVACAAVSASPESFERLVLLASPGVRAHAAFRRLPLAFIDSLLSRPRARRALRPVIRRLFAWSGFRGYPDRELERTLQCVAATSIDDHARRVRSLSIPTMVGWCDDDPLIEAEIMAELADVCPDGPRLHFALGGHNLQKSYAQEVAEALLTWPKPHA